MAVFDLDTFAKVTGETGTNFIEAAGASFGLPSCMLSFGRDVLSILPSNILNGLQSSIQAGKQQANNVTKKLFSDQLLGLGILEFDTETGTLQFKSINSALGIEEDQSSFLDDLNGVLGAFQQAVSFGSQLYQNYEDIQAQVNGIIDCFEKFTQIQNFQAGPAALQVKTSNSGPEFDAFKNRLQNSLAFVNAANASLAEINSVLAERQADPSLEPCFLNTAELAEALENTSYKTVSPLDPGVTGDEDAEVFRLVFGPPKSSDGQYLLSVDGLYYDSQKGGLDPIFVTIQQDIPLGDVYKYEFDPNLGGKGQAVSLDSLNKFTDNIFDPEIIDNSKSIQEFYEEDHFLQVLIQQKSKRASDLNIELASLIDEYGGDSSIVQNFRQGIISEITALDESVDKRKKQIEVAIKAPQIYGNGVTLFDKGEIPINDFSYLEELNLLVDLEKQKALVFDQGDVDGIVLPIKPTFVKSSQKPSSLSFKHLNVPPVGKGQIVYTPSGEQAASVLSLTDEITTDKMFAIYNFLETKTVLPSSVEYYTTNCATTNKYNNSQLVAANPKKVFFSGVGIPYFEGIVENKATFPAGASALGSFSRLPDTKEFRELTYNSSGFTVDFWTHIPDIMDGDVGWLSGTTSSLTKCVLACENVGAKEGVTQLDYEDNLSDLDLLENLGGDTFVRGMVMGFTRDRRITQEATGFSNDNELNNPTSSLSFFIAPTISRDLSSASWINNDDCQDFATFYKFKVDLADTAVGNVSSSFVHLSLSVDPVRDDISLYCDGALIATSSVAAVFGKQQFAAPGLPTFKKENSFEYSFNTVDGPDTIKTGPKLNAFYTPWIVGGGYTDGNYLQGNFMGGDRGGIVSGLRGFLGSLKFYSKPLDSSEALNNFNAQKGFFKNIAT